MGQWNQRVENCLGDSQDTENNARSAHSYFLHDTVNKCDLRIVLYEGRAIERQKVVTLCVWQKDQLFCLQVGIVVYGNNNAIWRWSPNNDSIGNIVEPLRRA